jgi:hypothetical protein
MVRYGVHPRAVIKDKPSDEIEIQHYAFVIAPLVDRVCRSQWKANQLGKMRIRWPVAGAFTV